MVLGVHINQLHQAVCHYPNSIFSHHRCPDDQRDPDPQLKICVSGSFTLHAPVTTGKFLQHKVRQP